MEWERKMEAETVRGRILKATIGPKGEVVHVEALEELPMEVRGKFLDLEALGGVPLPDCEIEWSTGLGPTLPRCVNINCLGDVDCELQLTPLLGDARTAWCSCRPLKFIPGVSDLIDRDTESSVDS